jgi:hypothetical protein
MFTLGLSEDELHLMTHDNPKKLMEGEGKDS